MWAFLIGSAWNWSEPVGTSQNMVGLSSGGTDRKWLSDWNPVGKKRGGSLLIWQVSYLEISDQNLIGIRSVPTGSERNLWGSDKTSLKRTKEDSISLTGSTFKKSSGRTSCPLTLKLLLSTLSRWQTTSWVTKRSTPTWTSSGDEF